MDTSYTALIDSLLDEPPQRSWHEKNRFDLGIPEDCANEGVLSLVVHRSPELLAARPLAFVLEDERSNSNTLLAVAEFMREVFHPFHHRMNDVVVLLDYLPPLDDFGAANGLSRRWVLDHTNYAAILGHVCSFVRTISA